MVITSYNFKEYLEQAVQSVLDQTFQATEIIIVDDGSTDGTPELGKALHDPWKGIHYIRQRNQGASAAANTGISKAFGRYITVLDGDDWMAPTRLEKMLTLAYRNPHSVIYDAMIFVREDTQVGHTLREYDFEELLYRNCMHKGILYPRKAWVEVGGYSNAMNDGREDWEFNIKLGLAGYCGVLLQEPLYMYRRQHQGRTQRVPKTRGYFQQKIIRLHPDVYNKGVRPMACCGKRATPKVATSPTISIRQTPRAATLKVAPDDTWVEIDFVANFIGNQTISGPSKNRYKYGRNQRNKRFWAHPDDVAFLLELQPKLFALHVPPATKKIAPVPAPEPEQVVVTEPEPAIIARVVPATLQARNLARQAGVMLVDVPYAGPKIGIADVRAYLDEVGIAY